MATSVELAGNTLLDRETWGLDAAGNWLAHSRTANSLMETRTVNALNQLTQTGGAGHAVVEGQVNEFASVTVNDEPAELRADPAAGGYRFRRTVPVTVGSNTVAIMATDPQSEVSTQNWQFNVPPVSRTFSYDANGNTLSDGVRTMTWDRKNRLKTVTKGGTTWKWDYDYRDRRVREYTNGVVTKLFIWNGKELIQERDAGNTVTRTHYFGGFIDGADPNTGAKYQTLTDHLGNVREVLTAGGTMAARYDYTPYQGPVKIGASTVDPTFLTIGRYYHHAGSGLELALYRAYDPELGRWMSRDPIEEDGGINLYGYVLNNPASLIDPDGKSPAWALPPQIASDPEFAKSYYETASYGALALLSPVGAMCATSAAVSPVVSGLAEMLTAYEAAGATGVAAVAVKIAQSPGGKQTLNQIMRMSANLLTRCASKGGSITQTGVNALNQINKTAGTYQQLP